MTDRLSLRGGLFLGSITKNMLQKKTGEPAHSGSSIDTGYPCL